MVAKLIDELARNPPQEIQALIRLIGIAAHDAPYRDLVNKNLKNFPNFQARKSLLEDGYFKEQDFLQLLSSCGDGKGTRTQMVMPLLNRLIEWGLVADNAFFGDNAFVKYQWNKLRITSFLKFRITDNVLLGPAYVAQKYCSSVPAVFIEKKKDMFTGTCFLATVILKNTYWLQQSIM
ncbi:MAG: hypothetical protein ABJL55_01240 [Roseibium sp.]